MIVKNDEADQKICPMGQASETGCRCAGEKCMAWRKKGPDSGYCGMCPVEPNHYGIFFEGIDTND